MTTSTTTTNGKQELDARGKSKCLEYAAKLIEPLRAIARTRGYALTVHGSLLRDIDLVAIPWTDRAVPAVELAEDLRQGAEAVIGFAYISEDERKDFPVKRPHGRLCWVFHLGGGPYIDLSVMPRQEV